MFSDTVMGLLGVGIGAIAAWGTALYVAHWSRTLELHREFNSERLGEARIKAFRFIKSNWGKSFIQITEQDELDLESAPLWEIMYFYQRLWAMIQHRQVISRSVTSLFGDIFVWWYTVVFRQQLRSSHWKAAKDIEAMYYWMKRRANAAQWSEWVERSEKDYDALKRKYSSECT